MQPYALNGRPLPLATPVTLPFFDAAREQRLVMQHCPRDGFFFYPRLHCPTCLGSDWAWRPVRASGRIHSFTVDRSGQDPHQRSRLPLIIALVDLDDGPRLIGNIAPPEDAGLSIGERVIVGFELLEGQPLVQFRRGA